MPSKTQQSSAPVHGNPHPPTTRPHPPAHVSRGVIPSSPQRDAYHGALKRLPIESPTVDDVHAVMPQAPRSEAARILRDGQKNSSGVYFPVPPLRIDNSFHTLNCYTLEGSTRLAYAFANRLPGSYTDNRLHGDITKTPSQADMSAIEYAQQQWGPSLIRDYWLESIEFHLINPHEKTQRGTPRPTGTIFATLTRDFSDIINDHIGVEHVWRDWEKMDAKKRTALLGNHESSLIEAHLSESTADYLIGTELRGDRGGFHEWNCAHCGGGMGLSQCSGCDAEVRDDGYRTGWSTPLPDTLRNLAATAGLMRP